MILPNSGVGKKNWWLFTSERDVLLFDRERNELKNSFTKKKLTDVAKFLLNTVCRA